MSAPITPFSGPWYGPSIRGAKAYRGPAAVALKRAVSRWDPKVLPWRRFNDRYNVRLENALKKFQRKHVLKATGQCGLPTFRALRRQVNRKGDPIFDHVCVTLFEDAWNTAHPPKPPAIVSVREALVEYLKGIEAHAWEWHYNQRRAYTGLGADPDDGGQADCSSSMMLGCFWARRETGIYVPDPSGFAYAGWGNTQSIWNRLSWNRVTDGKYAVGDMALYGSTWNTKHVTMCRSQGSSRTAIFTSDGSEAAPYSTRLFYRGDLLAVVRPVLVSK
jgi:hypothetical protein